MRDSALKAALAMLLALSVLVAVPGTAEAVDADYVDITSQLGISHFMDPGDLCTPPIGTGSAWADMDGDGDVDLYLTQRNNTLPNKLYRNDGDTDAIPDGLPNFTEVAALAGVDDVLSYSLSAVWIDYDNDGDQDLYVTNWDGNKLWENPGDTTGGDGIPDFIDVTATAGIADGGRAITSGWADFNNDSYLDLYVAKHRKCSDDPDQQDHLFMSNGDGTFTDVTHELCPGGVVPCDDVMGLGFSPGWFDYDNDGDQDLYLVNDNIGDNNQPNKHWRNDGSDGSGGWTFTYVADTAGTDVSANGMGLAIGDYNNDGELDIAFSDAGPANLLANNGDGTFTNTSVSSNVDALTNSVTWGTAFLDADNDRDLDLYLIAGDIGGSGRDNIYLNNNGDGTFADQSAASGLNQSGGGLAGSMVDIDNDGWVDVMVNNYGGNTFVFRNNGVAAGNTNNWLTVTVEGTDSNRDGIGTRIEYTDGTGTQIREISSGPTHGGGDYRAAYFGLGTETTGTLTIKWPNGKQQSFPATAANQQLHFVEPPLGDLFVDVAADTGIDFTHDIGSGCTPPIGNGSAWADIDGDGDLDLFVTQRSTTLPNALYMNQGDTSGDGLPDFVDAAAAAGVDYPAGHGLGAVFVDIDNDGDQDLFVSNLDDNKLYRNDGDIVGGDGVPDFTDITATAGVVDFGRAITPAFGDYDQDGFLDLYLPKHIRCSGQPTEDSEDKLFHNNGDNTFTDVTGFLCGGVAPCADTEGLGFSAGWFDYDDDGDQDLFLVNDNIGGTHQDNRLWRNDGSDGVGGWLFAEVSTAAGADLTVNGMGLGIGDLDNDGDFDVAFSNAAPAKVLSNNGDGTFADISVASGMNVLTSTQVTWGTSFFDYDNDQWEDLYFIAGEIGGLGQPNALGRNNGDSTFTDMSAATGLDDANKGRAASIVDFDQDGWVDVFIPNYGGPATLYRNQGVEHGSANGSVTVTVQGTDSNRDGIGTVLELTAGGITMMRQISSGPTHGGGDYRAAYFGLGANATGTLAVNWPNGAVTNFGTVNAGDVLHLIEPVVGPNGDVSGLVFDDLNGNGVNDAEPGLAGVAVSATDINGATFNGTTDGSGSYTLSGLAVGAATVTFTTPTGYQLTTANDVQGVTIVDGGVVNTADVGYEPLPAGDISVHVFDDADGDGIEDAGELGLAGVAVSATDANSAVVNGTTDSSGNATLSNLAVGSATVTFTTPSGFALTTGNDVQAITVVDGATVAAAAVGYESAGTPPDIVRISNSNTDIDQGTSKSFRVEVNDYTEPATWTFSGSGLTVTSATVGASGVRIRVTADATAAPGLRDLTVTLANGLSDTLVGAVTVIGTTPPPTGDVSGHVFSDDDGNGIEDGAEVGLSGVSVTITDAANNIAVVVTDANGDFLATGIGTGTASVDYSTPAGHVLTTGNASQTVVVPDSSVVATAAVGYQPIASGDLTGHVFGDEDGNGLEDGADVGLSGVTVNATDFNGSLFSTTTDSNGDYTITGLAVGDATVTFVTPASHTLTTGNDVQVVTIVDSATSATAAVGYLPPVGTPPVINSILNPNKTINQGQTKGFVVSVDNYSLGGTWTFEGTGLTVSGEIQAGQGIRITTVADAAAVAGFYDLTVTDINGLSDTLVDAIEVIGTTVTGNLYR